MLSQNERDFQPHVVSLETLVPADNFYREVEDKLDLSFVRDMVRHLYKPFGRPGIDPVVFFKLQLIMFFEGIRSERQLMDMVAMRLDCRWYIAYDLNENVPDHSSLTYIRKRFGLEIFQRFFEHIVELCIEAGLVWGKELYVDGTKVQANAAIDGLVPRWYWQAQQHLEAVFEAEPETVHSSDLNPPPTACPRGFVEKYDGARILGHREPSYERTTDSQVSLVDPDASPMRRFIGDRAQLGYHDHYVVDGGKARIILAALVTPASIMDNTPMLDLIRWARFRWHLQPTIVVGDTKFGTVPNIVGLEQDGLRAYLPTPAQSRSHRFYPLERFQYDPQRDLFICPQGQELPFYTCSETQQYLRYRADANLCNACPVKPECTDSKSGRSVHRSFFQRYLDRVQHYRETAVYKKAMRKRHVWVEPLFGEAKLWHQLRKFRLRGLIKVNIQGLLTAVGQNIKRLLKAKPHRNRPKPPANAVALKLPLSMYPSTSRF